MSAARALSPSSSAGCRMGEWILGMICPAMMLMAYTLVFFLACTGKKVNHGWED